MNPLWQFFDGPHGLLPFRQLERHALAFCHSDKFSGLILRDFSLAPNIIENRGGGDSQAQ